MFQIFKMLSLLPLWLLHGMGWCLGWLVFLASSGYRKRFVSNAKAAGVATALRRQSVGEAGKLVMELPRLWLGRPVTIAIEGSELIDAALQRGKGVLFLTPHLGCFEITAQAYAARYGVAGFPMTVLYRPPRQTWLRGLFASARTRPGMKAAPANLSGVKQMLKALKQGHAVGLLPDQVPPESQGVWAPFFGR
ncbi:MAG: lysophospholipid acyltransferase family protein, partial [Rhodoferax sp.]